MLDIIFVMLVLLGFFFILFSVYMKKEDPPEPYWNILFIVLAATVWFILALFATSGVESGYSAFNSTTGVTTYEYNTYVTEDLIYLSYFFGLMGVLSMIYLVVTIFGYYYKKLDEDMEKMNDDLME